MLDAAQRAGERGEAGAASAIDGAADPAAAAAAETAAASATAASDAASRAASAGAFARMVQARLATMPQAQRSALLGLLEQERASARAGAAAAASAAVLVQPGQEAGQGGQAEQLLAALRQISPAGYSSVAGMLLTPAADAGVTAGAAGADADLAEVAAALRTRAAGGAGTSQQCTTGGTAIEGTVCESPHGAGSGSVAACVNSSAPDSEGGYTWCAADGDKWGKCTDCPVTCERLSALLAAQLEQAQQASCEAAGAAAGGAAGTVAGSSAATLACLDLAQSSAALLSSQALLNCSATAAAAAAAKAASPSPPGWLSRPSLLDIALPRNGSQLNSLPLEERIALLASDERVQAAVAAGARDDPHDYLGGDWNGSFVRAARSEFTIRWRANGSTHAAGQELFKELLVSEETRWFAEASGGAPGREAELAISWDASGGMFEWRGLRQLASDLQLAGLSLLLAYLFIAAHTRSLFLGTLGALQIGLSFPLSLGVYTHVLRIPLFGVLHVLGLYVILGIGCDDIFVLSDAFAQSAWAAPAEARSTTLGRMRWAYRRAIGAIVVTTMTDCMAFLASAICIVPNLVGFGIFTALLAASNLVLVSTNPNPNSNPNPNPNPNPNSSPNPNPDPNPDPDPNPNPNPSPSPNPNLVEDEPGKVEQPQKGIEGADLVRVRG